MYFSSANSFVLFCRGNSLYIIIVNTNKNKNDILIFFASESLVTCFCSFRQFPPQTQFEVAPKVEESLTNYLS